MTLARPRPHTRRSRSRLVGIGTALAVLAGAAVATAAAETSAAATTQSSESSTDYAYGKGEFLSGQVAGTDLASILEIEPAIAENRGEPDPATSTARLNVRALDAIEVRLEKALQLLPGNGAISIGAVNQFAQAAAGGSSRAAAGAVNDSGAIAIGATDEWPSNASVSLRKLLGGGELTELADLRLEVGAISATAEQYGAEEPEGGYQIAELRLELDAPVVGELVASIELAVAAVEDALNGLVGSDGALAGVLETVSGLTRLIGTDGVQIAIDSDLQAAIAPALTQTVGDGVVEIDLTTGTITVDLEALLDLNHLPVGTEVLSAEVIAEIVDRIAAVLDGVVADVLEIVLDALDAATLTIKVDATVLGNGVRLDLAGSLREVLTGTAEGGELTTVVLGQETTLASLPDVLSPVTATVHSTLFDEGGAVSALEYALAGATGDVGGVIGPVLAALPGLVSLRANVQETGAAGEFIQRALQLTVPVAQLNLANAIVGPNVLGEGPGDDDEDDPGYPGNGTTPDTDRELFAEVAVKAIRHGEIQTLTAWGFDPGEEVRAEIHQPVWHLPGTEIADEDGQVVFRFVIPEEFTVAWHTAYAVSVEQGDWAGDTFEVVVDPAGPGGSLPRTGLGAGALLLAGLGLAAAGGGVLMARRRLR